MQHSLLLVNYPTRYMDNNRKYCSLINFSTESFHTTVRNEIPAIHLAYIHMCVIVPSLSNVYIQFHIKIHCLQLESTAHASTMKNWWVL